MAEQKTATNIDTKPTPVRAETFSDFLNTLPKDIIAKNINAQNTLAVVEKQTKQNNNVGELRQLITVVQGWKQQVDGQLEMIHRRINEAVNSKDDNLVSMLEGSVTGFDFVRLALMNTFTELSEKIKTLEKDLPRTALEVVDAIKTKPDDEAATILDAYVTQEIKKVLKQLPLQTATSDKAPGTIQKVKSFVDSATKDPGETFLTVFRGPMYARLERRLRKQIEPSFKNVIEGGMAQVVDALERFEQPMTDSEKQKGKKAIFPLLLVAEEEGILQLSPAARAEVTEQDRQTAKFIGGKLTEQVPSRNPETKVPTDRERNKLLIWLRLNRNKLLKLPYVEKAQHTIENTPPSADVPVSVSSLSEAPTSGEPKDANAREARVNQFAQTLGKQIDDVKKARRVSDLSRGSLDAALNDPANTKPVLERGYTDTVMGLLQRLLGDWNKEDAARIEKFIQKTKS